MSAPVLRGDSLVNRGPHLNSAEIGQSVTPFDPLLSSRSLPESEKSEYPQISNLLQFETITRRYRGYFLATWIPDITEHAPEGMEDEEVEMEIGPEVAHAYARSSERRR
jgi:hypothetical protein